MNNTSTITPEQSTQLQRDVERLKADLRDLRSNLADMAADSKETARQAAGEVRENLHGRVRSVVQRGREAVVVVEDQVARHPFAAVGAALAAGAVAGAVAGVVLGAAVSRRGRE
jgi:ElaB/YqjD/DUF883 family membrane-anchored ribosome-binding protein